MYLIFEIMLKPKRIDLEKNLDSTRRLGWYSNGQFLVRDDDGLKYVLDLSSLKLRCVMIELFPLEEGEWSSRDNPSREEIVNRAIAELKKLPFNLEVEGISTTVRHEQ
jgi:hypothetical protein